MTKGQDIEKLFKETFEHLYCYATSLIHNEEQARDIVQELFAKMIETDTLPESRSYLYTAVKNRCITYIRDTEIHSRIENEYLLEVDEYENEDVYSEEILNKINQIIDSMPLQCRRVVELRFEHGLKFIEIAELMGVSRNMVFRYLRQVLETIRKNISYGQV